MNKVSEKLFERRDKMEIETNLEKCRQERASRDRRLEIYREALQNDVQNMSSEVIRRLVEERKRQGKTQQEMADITGIQASNLARFETGDRVPTLVVLQKYATALGKRILIEICDQ